MKRLAASHLCESFGLSIQRAVTLVALQRSSFYYQPKGTQDDAPIISRMKVLVERHKHMGLMMMHDILRREGLVINRKRTWRIYRAQGLSLTARRRPKRTAAVRLKLPGATHPNERWSMDFIQSVFWHGRRFRMLTVVDNFTKECPVIEVDTSLNGVRVARARPG